MSALYSLASRSTQVLSNASSNSCVTGPSLHRKPVPPRSPSPVKRRAASPVKKMSSTPPNPSPSRPASLAPPNAESTELSAVVDDLLNSLTSKFMNVSNEILAKMDDMSRRLDRLEEVVQAQAAGEK